MSNAVKTRIDRSRGPRCFAHLHQRRFVCNGRGIAKEWLDWFEGFGDSLVVVRVGSRRNRKAVELEA